MLRFDKTKLSSSLLNSNLSVSLSIKTWDLEVLEFINIISILLYLYWLKYVIAYFFSNLFWMRQGINDLPHFI